MNARATLLEALERCIAQGLTFAAFRTPGQPVQLWAQRTPDVETVDGTLLFELNQVFLIAPFDLDRTRVPFIRSDVELEFGELPPDIDRLNECVGYSARSVLPGPPTPRSVYERTVNQAKAAMASGPLKKVVLSRTLNVELDPVVLPELFLLALDRDANTCVVMAHTPENGLWMGASPERLVHERTDHVRVDALAGTFPAQSAPTQASAWGEKERDEQELVTQHVRDIFNSLGLQNIKEEGPAVLQAGAVSHLHTALEADLGPRTLGELVLALHPTPAICGTPTAAAAAFVSTHETHSRQLYSGFWGPWSADGPTELFVNIRCMRVHDLGAQLFVGAGITAGSDAQREWDETAHKANTLLEPIGSLRGTGII